MKDEKLIAIEAMLREIDRLKIDENTNDKGLMIVINELIRKNNSLVALTRDMYQRKFEVGTIPPKFLMRGTQAPHTRILGKNSTEQEITIDWPFVITHIARMTDTYDNIDTNAIPYLTSLVQILVDGWSLSNVPFDVSMLPIGRKLALELPTPLYVAEGSKIQLDGAVGLDNLRIALYGYRIDEFPGGAEVLKPYFLCGRLDATTVVTEKSKTINIPSWMSIDINQIWSFIRFKPSCINNLGYADYEHSTGSICNNVMQSQSGNFISNIEYQQATKGYQFLWKDDYVSLYTGTREFVSKISDLYPDLKTDINIKANPPTLVSGASLYKWIILGGKYKVTNGVTLGK